MFVASKIAVRVGRGTATCSRSSSDSARAMPGRRGSTEVLSGMPKPAVRSARGVVVAFAASEMSTEPGAASGFGVAGAAAAGAVGAAAREFGDGTSSPVISQCIISISTPCAISSRTCAVSLLKKAASCLLSCAEECLRRRSPTLKILT